MVEVFYTPRNAQHTSLEAIFAKYGFIAGDTNIYKKSFIILNEQA